MAMQQICTFFLETARFGLPVDAVQEVIRQPPLTRIPLAAPDLCGLMNLRGQVIPVVDLPGRLGLRSPSCVLQQDEQMIYNVIVQTADDVVAFVVDGIGDVLSCEGESLQPPPATLALPVRCCLQGTYPLENEFLLLLDPSKILDSTLLRRYS